MNTILSILLAAQLPIHASFDASPFWSDIADRAYTTNSITQGSRAYDDDDSDGLPNAIEAAIPSLSPTNAFSLSADTLDFYCVISNAFAGVLYTDHDFIDDFWEDSVPFASRHTHDFAAFPFLDGWTSWDYCRAALFPSHARPGQAGSPLRPSPTLHVTASYLGSQHIQAYTPLVIHAFSSSIASPDAVFSISNAAQIAHAPLAADTSTPISGFLKRGQNHFTAFLDLDNSGSYTTGEPFGYATASVGWHAAFLSIPLSDTSPVITRFDLSNWSTDRETLYGLDAGDVTNLTEGVASGGRYERVRVIRTQVNGWGIQTLGMENRVIFDELINLDARPYVSELDVLALSGGLDTDWFDFQTEVMGNRNVTSGKIDPTSVTYRIVLGSGTIDTGESNNLFRVATVRRYDAADARARPAFTHARFIPNSLAPSISWRIADLDPNMGIYVHNGSYTAFKLQISSTSDFSSIIYDSGVRLLPPPTSDGTYHFSPQAFVGSTLSPGATYYYRVAAYNSKFRSDYFSETDSFSVPQALPCRYVSVFPAYHGNTNGTLIVSAHASPDFSDAPVSAHSIQNFSASYNSSFSLPLPISGDFYLQAILEPANPTTNTLAKPFAYLHTTDASSPALFNPATASPANRLYILDP